VNEPALGGDPLLVQRRALVAGARRRDQRVASVGRADLVAADLDGDPVLLGDPVGGEGRAEVGLRAVGRGDLGHRRPQHRAGVLDRPGEADLLGALVDPQGLLETMEIVERLQE
jgi:hypothetical protein